MKKFNLNFQCKLLLFFLLLLLIIYIPQFFNSSIKEGVVFTPYNNRTFFTHPWDDFCIPDAPSCQKPFLEKPGMIGIYPIGCNCKGIGKSMSPPAIEPNCLPLDYDHPF